MGLFITIWDIKLYKIAYKVWSIHSIRIYRGNLPQFPSEGSKKGVKWSAVPSISLIFLGNYHKVLLLANLGIGTDMGIDYAIRGLGLVARQLHSHP